MSLFPRIDQPCPLAADEQRRIEGHCARCDTHVHALDDMSPTQRRELLAAANGPLCVSYRRSARVAQVAAIAITLIAGSAFAGDGPSAQAGSASAPPAVSATDEKKPTELEEVVILGGISDPADAEWVDDGALPELPVIDGDEAPAGAASTSD